MGAAFALLIWLPYEASNDNKYLFGALTIMFVIGLRDDLIPLKASYKLISQLVPAFMIIYFAEIQLSSFYDISSVNFPEPLTWLVTIFVIIVITNSINLIDGLDGLAGSVSFITLGSMGIWFFLTENYGVSFIISSFLGGIIAFLIFNWQPSKIFMGDTGALLLGFLQAAMVILFINTNYYLPETVFYKFTSSIGAALCIMIIPLMDTLRVFLIRLYKSKSPFAADNNHIHHLLIKAGLSHSSSVIILIFINLLFIIMAILLKNKGDLFVICSTVILALIVIAVIYLYSSKSNTQKA